MIISKRMYGSLSEKKEDQQMNKRILLSMTQKRDLWNSRRRFGY